MVLDTRDPMEEQPFDPSAVVRAAGLTYVNIPVSHGPNEDHTYDAVRRTLRAVADSHQRAFVYCNSGNRVGAALLPYLMLDRGLEEDAAVTTAMQIGTRSAELIEEALDYVRRKRGKGKGEWGTSGTGDP